MNVLNNHELSSISGGLTNLETILLSTSIGTSVGGTLGGLACCAYYTKELAFIYGMFGIVGGGMIGGGLGLIGAGIFLYTTSG